MDWGGARWVSEVVLLTTEIWLDTTSAKPKIEFAYGDSLIDDRLISAFSKSDFVAKGDFCTYFHNQSLKFSKVAGKRRSTATEHLILLSQLDVAVARIAVFKNPPVDSEWKRRESARLLAFKQQKHLQLCY